MRNLLIFALVAALALVLATRTQARPTPRISTAEVDLARYMGRWWVIGHVPYFAERGKLATADIYALREDGRIENVYVYRKAFGKPEKRMNAVATVLPGTRNTQWKIRFFGGLVSADYLILEVAPDYSWALIGQPSGKLAWVFAREQRMDDARFAELSGKLAAYGYDPRAIRRVPQFPEQLPARR